MAAGTVDEGIILRPQRGDYLSSGRRLLYCESMTKDGAVFENCMTGHVFSSTLEEIGRMGLKLEKKAPECAKIRD